MNTRQPARELARDLCRRPACHVQVAAVLCDRYGHPFAWGWNHAGNGMGEHAEAYALRRANPRRCVGATIVVYGQWRKHGHPVLAKPCPDCEQLLRHAGVRRIEYVTKNGTWTTLLLLPTPTRGGSHEPS